MDKSFYSEYGLESQGAWWKIKNMTAGQWFTFICTLEFSLYSGKWASCTNALVAAFVKLLSRRKGLLSQILHCHCNYLKENLCQWLFTPWWSPFQRTTQMSSSLKQITPLLDCMSSVFLATAKWTLREEWWDGIGQKLLAFLNCMYIHLPRFIRQGEKTLNPY